MASQPTTPPRVRTPQPERAFPGRLSGRYEVLISGQDGLIQFVNSLEAAAELLSESTGGRKKPADLLLMLQQSEQRGQLRPGGAGQRFYDPHLKLTHGNWMGRVRGGRTRAAPLYSPGQVVYADSRLGGLPANMSDRWSGTVHSIQATDHGSPDRVYRYQVGIYTMRENRLRVEPVDYSVE